MHETKIKKVALMSGNMQLFGEKSELRVDITAVIYYNTNVISNGVS